VRKAVPLGTLYRSVDLVKYGRLGYRT